MSKLLKSWKILSFGLLSVALGLMMASCAETNNGTTDTETYTVTLKGGGTGYVIGNYSTEVEATSFEAGDTVVVTSGIAPAGKEFDRWSFSPASLKVVWKSEEEIDGLDPFIVFVMPESNVTVTANWANATVADGPYYVTVVGGVLVDDEGEEIDANTEYDSRDPVYIYANAKPDSLFFKWTSSSGVSFYSDTLQLTSFVMLSKNVTVTATYIAKPDPSAVRFTWEKAAQSKIQSIAASKSDYQSWFEDVYMAESYIEEDATDVPLYSGSDQLPNNIYSSTLHAKSGSPYKSRYFSISEGDDDGKYTAVCTVDDPAFDNIADIVANYDVSVTGDNVFFEVAFDVDTFLEGEDDIGWFPESRDNPYSDPRLEKAKAKKLVKKVQKNNVTYYILHRPRK